MIKVNNLNKFFNKGKTNELHVINDTTVEFGDTGLVCILGESGSGKTTFLNTVGGLDTFLGGSITINDKTLTKYSAKNMEELRNSKFAYIFQEQYLLQEDTVGYNIRLALYMSDISEEEIETRVDYVLQAVDMKKYKKRLVSQLSGGQQQRVAIARALVKSPDIIFADEPTGNLDEANTMRIMSIIKKISKDCLVILVTHERRIAEFFADRIIQIQEGKITSDISHEGRNTYKRSDDTNIYLKEFDKVNYHNEYFDINFYCQESLSKNKKDNILRITKVGDQKIGFEVNQEIKLNLVYSEGKLYIQAADDSKLVILNQTSEMQMIDDVKPEPNLDQVEEFDYSLAKLKNNHSSNLTMKEIIRLAKSNMKRISKKQIFMIITYIITSVLLVLTVSDYMTTAAIDKKSIITDDSHYLSLSAKRNSSASNTQYYSQFNEIYYNFLNKNIADDIFLDLNTKLYFRLKDSYGQIRRLSRKLPEATYVTIDHLKPEDLILGRMPDKRNEIVVDKWLIDVFLKEDIFKNLMTMEDFIGLNTGVDDKEDLIIIGISDTEEPTIYIDKYLGISLAPWADKVASLNQLREMMPGEYDNINLAANEVLVSESVYEELTLNGENFFTAKNGIQYKITGTYPEGFDMSYVIEDSYYKELLNSYICINRKFKIYGEEKEAVMNYFSLEEGFYDSTYVEMGVRDTYQEKLNHFNAERAIKLNARFFSTVAILILSLFILYFIMKSNVIARAQELTVYRMLGITKQSIVAAFMIEVLLITSYTVLPVVLIMSSALKFIAVIPSLELNIVYPWYAVIALLVFIYTVNIIIGTIPVYNIVKLPPAQLAEKV